MKPEKVGIIGAGPAGAWLAQSLSKQGFKVSLFDHRAPWKKPCAGGLYTVIWDEFPELDPVKALGLAGHKARLVTVKKDIVEIDFKRPLYTVSREKLGQYLLDQARASGAEFIARKIEAVSPKDSGFEISDERGEQYQVDFLVGADGAGSVVRRRLAPGWSQPDFIFTLSALVDRAVNFPLTFYFFPGFAGYGWIFPGRDAVSIGIGAKAGQYRAEEMTGLINQMAGSEPELGKKDFALGKDLTPAMIPGLSLHTLRSQKVVGKNWALIGDAAGAAHPVSGGGIHNAFRTAKYLADSLMAGTPELYQDKFWEFCKEELLVPCLWEPLFYKTSMQNLFAKMMVRSESARILAGELLPGGKVKRGKVFRVLLKALVETLF